MFTLCINDMCSTPLQGYGSIAPRPAVLHIKTIKMIIKSYQTAGVYTYCKPKVYTCYVNHVLNNMFTLWVNNMCNTPAVLYNIDYR